MEHFSASIHVYMLDYIVSSLFRNPEQFAKPAYAMALVWFAYILPQAFGILISPNFLPYQVYKAGFFHLMVMSTLCLAMGWLGANVNHRQKKTAFKTNPRADNPMRTRKIPRQKLYVIALFLTILHLVFSIN